LRAASAEAFQRQHPYPWLRVEKTLTDEGFGRLCENMPDTSLFNREEGVKARVRARIAQPLLAALSSRMKLPKPWMDFLAELEGDEYRSFLRRMLGGNRRC